MSDILGAEELQRLCQLIYRSTGIAYGEGKRYYVERRLLQRMAATATPTIAAYLAVLRAGGPELEQLINSFTVNETYEPLAESRGRVIFGLSGSEFGETSYPVCGTLAASPYSHGKNAEGADNVSQRNTFHILGSPASGASALAG